MNAAQFSHALGKVNDKYIMEAITYERKKKRGWLKWGGVLWPAPHSGFDDATGHFGGIEQD